MTTKRHKEPPKKVFIVAGETSGEQYGALLARELREASPGIQIQGIGGEAMQGEDIQLIAHVKDLAVVGLTEVLAKYSKLKKVFDDTVRFIEETKPDVVVLIDYPGFNLRLAKRIKPMGIPIVYYISPQIWAWHRSRVHELGRLCTKILVVFDFEVDLYADEGYTAIHVGHPLLDRLENHQVKNLREEFNVPKDTLVLGLLPGSRRQEIERLLPIYLGACSLLASNNVKIAPFMAAAPLVDLNTVRDLLGNFDVPVEVLQGRAYDVMASSDLVYVASGTATLETAVFGTPMIITYKTGAITYLVGKSVLNVDWIGLPNIIANAEIVPELLQENCKPEYIATLTANLISNAEAIAEIRENLSKVKESLGGVGASKRAAAEVLSAVRPA
ncbi:MAG: lipid-A-disaccharide synthase [Planctomycetota bacterium]